MGVSGSKDEGSAIKDLGNGFYNIRGHFRIYSGLVDIGTHMSLLKLRSGKFLVIDTVPLDDKLKQELDALTENGSLMEAVVATHPFHTLAFPDFHKAYPKVPMYGTPRHIRNQGVLPWIDDVSMPEVQKKWLPDVDMRIPAGGEFDSPTPEAYNHFSAVWVFHRASRTLHVDDTLMYFHDPGLAMKLSGIKTGSLDFHRSIKGPGLYHTPEAPRQFQAWVQGVIDDWTFENICASHTGNKIGGARQQLQQLLSSSASMFDRLVDRNRKEQMKAVRLDGDLAVPASPSVGRAGALARSDSTVLDEQEAMDCGKYNVSGVECG